MTKVSVKSVIEAGLEKGSSIKVILGQIKKKCPDSKADESHIRFYANKMVRDGKMKAEVAQTKYGCGTRGRKASAAITKKPVAKKPMVKKPVAKKPMAKKPATKKSVASKKSGSVKSKKTS